MSGLPASGPGGGGARAVAGGGAMLQAAPRGLTFQDVVALAAQKRDVMLYAHLRQSAHLVRFAPPVIELRLADTAPRDTVQKLAAMLEAETGKRWTIALSNLPGEPTIDEAEGVATAKAKDEALAHPLVQAILTAFPGRGWRHNMCRKPSPKSLPIGRPWCRLTSFTKEMSDEESRRHDEAGAADAAKNG